MTPEMTAGLAAPVAALVDVGVLDEITAAGATSSDISRAHPVWRVTLADGRRLVVKAGLGHGGPDLAVECLVYRMTWWCQPLADALPTPLVVDEDRQLLVLADVGEPGVPGSLAQQVGFPALLGRAGTTRGQGPAGPDVDAVTARTLGRTVGALHRATAGFPLPPAPPPLVLGLVGRTDGRAEGETAGLAPLVRQTVAALGVQRAVTAAVAELRRPVAGCLVNHDLKWDNVVLTGGVGDRRPVLLDWELAGLGDPAWDLGCLLAEHLVRGVDPDLVVLAADARALLAGYRNGAGLNAAVIGVFAHRVALAAGLRVAQFALEVAYTPYSGDGEAVTRLIERSAELLAAAPALAEEVDRCLS